jgi:hypothetical protein
MEHSPKKNSLFFYLRLLPNPTTPCASAPVEEVNQLSDTEPERFIITVSKYFLPPPCMPHNVKNFIRI